MAKATCSVPVCDRGAHARGLCDPHYKRLRRNGTTGDTAVSEGPEERFWRKVNKTATCWLWTSWLSDQGYGGFYVSPQRRASYAHRMAYEWLVGPIADGLHLDHLCRVRHCVNPAHLEPVTPHENHMRGEAPHAINKRKTFCIDGHEFTPENTYRRPDNGNRQCRACNIRRTAERTARRVAARAAAKAFSD